MVIRLINKNKQEIKMKKLVFGLMSLLLLSASVFAQSDLQPLAVVKLNKNESITVKELKKDTTCNIKWSQ